MNIILGDSPDQNGCYVVYEDVYAPYARKVFLTFYNGKWGYTGSDQQFRGTIIGYIGPMPSPKIKNLVGEPGIRYATGKMPDGLHGSFIGGPSYTVKELINTPGDKGDYVFKLYTDCEAKIIGKWNNEKNKWVKKLKLKKTP